MSEEKEVWYGPLSEEEVAGWRDLAASSLGTVRIEAEGTPEPWAVMAPKPPAEALPALTAAIALDARTVGTFETIRRAEAMKRLGILKSTGLHPNVAREFEAEGKLNCSERRVLGRSAFGALFWLNEERLAKVRDLEDEYGFLAYHAISEATEFGNLLDLLIVTDSVEEWPNERNSLERGTPFSYVVNETNDDFSEFGSIGIKVVGGGVVRTD